MESEEWGSVWKNIVSGKPFLFYFLNDKIEIIKPRDDQVAFMASEEGFLLGFGNGLYI